MMTVKLQRAFFRRPGVVILHGASSAYLKRISGAMACALGVIVTDAELAELVRTAVPVSRDRVWAVSDRETPAAAYLDVIDKATMSPNAA